MKYTKVIALLVVIGMISFAGCAEKEGEEQREKQKEYHSEGGASLTYPGEWTMEEISTPLSGVKFIDPKDENAHFFVVHRPEGEGKIMRPMLLMALLGLHQTEKYEAPSAEMVTVGGKQGTGIFAEMTLPEKDNVRIKAYFIDLTYGDLEYWIVCCSSKDTWESHHWPIFNEVIESVTFE